MTSWVIEFRRFPEQGSGLCQPTRGFLSLRLANAAVLSEEQALETVKEELRKRRSTKHADCLVQVEAIRKVEEQ